MHEISVEVYEEHAPFEVVELAISVLVHVQEHLKHIFVELLVATVISQEADEEIAHFLYFLRAPTIFVNYSVVEKQGILLELLDFLTIKLYWLGKNVFLELVLQFLNSVVVHSHVLQFFKNFESGLLVSTNYLEQFIPFLELLVRVLDTSDMFFHFLLVDKVLVLLEFLKGELAVVVKVRRVEYIVEVQLDRCEIFSVSYSIFFAQRMLAALV